MALAELYDWFQIRPEDDEAEEHKALVIEAIHERDRLRAKVKEAEIAYGLLWMSQTADPRVHAARLKLLATMDQAAQARGIAAARKMQLTPNAELSRRGTRSA